MKFNFHKALLSGMSVIALGAMALPMTANADVGIYLTVPPPPLRVEHVPPPRPGYVWAPGYWDARGSHHVWHTGHWERERHGYHYTQPSWEQHDNRWELHRGRWERGDDDHDGVSNGHDRAPENPYRH